jgi:hypothetical protein
MNPDLPLEEGMPISDDALRLQELTEAVPRWGTPSRFRGHDLEPGRGAALKRPFVTGAAARQFYLARPQS